MERTEYLLKQVLKFEDLVRIGQGAYGLVFRAKTPEGFIRALKVQFSNLVTDPDAIDNEFGEFKINKMLG
jgi:hypothetical protein